MAPEQTSPSPALAMHGLSKRYGSVRALDRVTLAVDRGEIFGFLGPNGAGKTTAIRILLDLIRPTAGTAAIFGFDAQQDSLDVRRHVGYLPGDLALYGGLTGAGALDLFAGLRGGGADGRERRALADRLQLDLGRPIHSLSHGQRRKVGLLQALEPDPPLLLLDEPTAGLDPVMRRMVLQLIRERADAGTTVFFSSHVLPEVELVCDRIGVLRAGRLLDVLVVDEVRDAAPRRVEVTFGVAPDPAEFAGIRGVTLAEQAGSRWAFRVDGGIDGLIKHLARCDIVDLRAERPRLEDVVLPYYEGAKGLSRAGAD